jgi:hypothetical protein
MDLHGPPVVLVDKKFHELLTDQTIYKPGNSRAVHLYSLCNVFHLAAVVVQEVEEDECLAHGQTVLGIFSIYVAPYPAGHRADAKAIKTVKYVHVILCCLFIPRWRIEEKTKYLCAPGQSTTYIVSACPE